MDRLLIVGTGGHGRVVANIAKLSGRYGQIDFIDDADDKQVRGYRVVGKLVDIDQWIGKCDFFVAIGDNRTRHTIMSLLDEKGAQLATLIHPSAVIADDVEIGCGSVVIANAVINCGGRIGKGVIINTAATVDHDNVIHDYAHISPGAHLAGTVQIGGMTWIGIGASVSNNVNICCGCTVGAGAVVIRDITKAGTYAGVPAVALKGNSK